MSPAPNFKIFQGPAKRKAQEADLEADPWCAMEASESASEATEAGGSWDLGVVAGCNQEGFHIYSILFYDILRYLFNLV